MSTSPRVSIGIPTFNRPRLLHEALQSVLLQTCQDFEVVVADDGSTPETRQVVQGFGDPRIRYHRNATNIGVQRNWNQCVRLSRGEYCTILPDDDVYLPPFLETMCALLSEKPEAAFAQCAFYGVDAALRPIGVGRPSSRPVELRGADGVVWQLMSLACNPVALM